MTLIAGIIQHSLETLWGGHSCNHSFHCVAQRSVALFFSQAHFCYCKPDLIVMSLHRHLTRKDNAMALNLLPDQPAERRLPEPFYVAKCRNELLHHAKDHPELTLLLEALEEVGKFSARMRELYLQAEHGAVRAVLNGRYGLSNSCEDACSDISALAWDWADDTYGEREQRCRYD